MLNGVSRYVPGLVVAGVLCLVAARPASAVCVGECELGSAVQVNDIVKCVNIFLGTADVSNCSQCDQDGNGTVGINEVVQAVNSYLNPDTCPMVMGGGPTPTPTVPPLGLRVFSVADHGKSGLFSTALAGGDATSTGFLTGPLMIEAGPVDPATGIAQLSLQEDVILGIPLIAGQTPVCLKLYAAGSHGSVDCDGGSSYDVLLSQDSHKGGTPDPEVLMTGQGSDAGPGAATLFVMSAGGQLPAGDTDPADCNNVEYTSPSEVAYTTASATAQVINPKQGGTVMITKSGVNFDCADWTNSSGVGRIATPEIGLATIIGDTAEVLVLSGGQ